ncbi:MAG: EVE domain-containing protein [Clostridium sp.]|nr:EVE domain-containing protein [Clostridium sp.]MCM1568593.1 EVE domain-containing protein [Roseburia sp.]
MIDIEKLRPILEGYKAYFPSHWEDEKYKWEAIKHFQTHWNIEAENFGDMFKEATDRTYNLLASGYAYPRGMITNFAKADDEFVRQMFRDLYDEGRNLAERVAAFQTSAEELRAKYDDGTWRNHYQNTNAISTYLWLMYPDKYYIYKYELYRDAAAELSADYKPKRNGSVETMIGGFAMYDEICAVIQQEDEIKGMLQNALSDSCYDDPALKTVTIDVGFYLCRFYLEAAKTAFYAGENSESADSEAPGFWWLTANPAIWSFSDIEVGEEESYTLYNDKGNKRHVFQNFLDAKAGDIVIGYESNPVKKVVAICRITQENDGEAIYFEKIEGLSVPIEYQTLRDCSELDKMEFFVQPNGSLFKLTKGEYDFIMDMVREVNPLLHPDALISKYSKEDFLKVAYMTEGRYDVLEALLRNKMNIILQGAPGVGKTFIAKKLAYAMMGEEDDSRMEIVQFHQNYSYEDFIMGYRPKGADFKLTDGIFYRFCQTAANHPDKPYFFIIDEINRGNMSKIFGELLMLIEKDYRGTKVTLAYSGMPFSVPENLYIIGMMNTADRSLAMIDYALRRRFSFFEMEPGFDSDGFMQYQSGFANETFNTLIDQIKMLNKEIVEDKSLGRGFCIGHSYFCGRKPGECTIDWMRSVVEFDILPMLSEYWFDEPAKLQRWEKNLRGVFDDE